jgi:excisionase family DNA binding protein
MTKSNGKNQKQQPSSGHCRSDKPKSTRTTGWLTIKEAADYVGLGERTIHNWRKKGLKYSKHGSKVVRIRAEDIDEFLFSGYSDHHPDLVDLNVDAIIKSLTK